MLVHSVGLQDAFDFMHMSVFRFDRCSRDAGEIMGVVVIGANAVIEMEMEAVKAHHVPGISE